LREPDALALASVMWRYCGFCHHRDVMSVRLESCSRKALELSSVAWLVSDSRGSFTVWIVYLFQVGLQALWQTESLKSKNEQGNGQINTLSRVTVQLESTSHIQKNEGKLFQCDMYQLSFTW